MITRFNYLTPQARDRVAATSLAIALDPRLRASLLAVVGAFVLVGAMYLFESFRLHVAENDDAVYTAARMRSAHELHGVELLDAQVRDLQAIAASVETIRGSGVRHESELASIGNDIPKGAWISAIRSDVAGWRIEGRSENLSTVGTTMNALRRKQTTHATRLISLHGPGKSATDPVQYELTLESTP